MATGTAQRTARTILGMSFTSVNQPNDSRPPPLRPLHQTRIGLVSAALTPCFFLPGVLVLVYINDTHLHCNESVLKLVSGIFHFRQRLNTPDLAVDRVAFRSKLKSDRDPALAVLCTPVKT